MPDREAPRSTPDPGASRLEAVERLRRQLEQIESRTRSAGSRDKSPAESVRRDRSGGAGHLSSSAPDSWDATGSTPDPYGGAAECRPEVIGQETRAARKERRRASRRRSPEDESGSAERSAGAGRGDDRRTGEPVGGTEAQAKDVCLRLLTDRARSRAELADKLAAKGFTAHIAERVLNRLTEVGLVDDAAFAEQWVHSRHTFSGKGKKVLAQELRRKGVSDAHAEPALAAITPADESARAAELVQRKLTTLPADLPRDKVAARLVGMLARRGYQQSMAYAVVKDELDASDREPNLPDPTRQPLELLDRQPPRPHYARSQRSTGVERLPQEDDPEQPSGGPETARMRRTPTPVLDEEQAAELVRRKLRSMSPDLPTDKATARLVGLLARRGCPQSLAYAVVRAELAHRPTDLASAGAASPQERIDLASADPVAEDEQARELVRRKLRTMPGKLTQDKMVNRLIGMLARRGYGSSIAYTVVKEELAAADLL